MAKSTNKAKIFFASRQKATPTTTVVNAAADTDKTPKKRDTKTEVPPTTPPIQSEPISSVPTKEQASGKKVEVAAELPKDLKNFIEQNDFTLSGKINTNIPIEIDNRLQIALLQLKGKYRLNNRQINKTILISYIIDKVLRNDEFFATV
jgi:hypothetical protein